MRTGGKHRPDVLKQPIREECLALKRRQVATLCTPCQLSSLAEVMVPFKLSTVIKLIGNPTGVLTISECSWTPGEMYPGKVNAVWELSSVKCSYQNDRRDLSNSIYRVSLIVVVPAKIYCGSERIDICLSGEKKAVIKPCISRPVVVIICLHMRAHRTATVRLLLQHWSRNKTYS